MRSIRNRVTLLFFAITLTAIAGIYVYVVPQLAARLRDQKLHALADASRTYSGALAEAIGPDATRAQVRLAVRTAADRSGARVTLLGVSTGTLGVQTFLIADSSSASRDTEDLAWPAASEAARGGRLATGSESSNSGRLGEAAQPLFLHRRVARVIVYSAPLGDVASNVALIRKQIAIAGAIALLFAVLAGYLVARALARRIKRLETAADQVAGGDFSRPIPVERDDELGQLAEAFNAMQRQLAELDSARKRFIATASHELRTPIFSLGGFVELLQDEDIDDETREQFLAQIAEQIARLRTLSTELLDLSKLEAGSLELRPEPTDLGELARMVTAEFTPALAQHESRLDLELDGPPIKAVCDPERVAQIMRILIDNAVAHTPPGTDIAVSATRENGGVHMCVTDRGLGIKRTIVNRVFEPFFTSDDAQGSGLGLAIARELAERMDGRLAVDSIPGRTRFTLELPA